MSMFKRAAHWGEAENPLKTFLAGQMESFASGFFVLSPLFLGCGIGLYFGLSAEPDPAYVISLIAFLAMLLAVTAFYKYKYARHQVSFILISALMVSACGFGLAQLRTHSVDTIFLEKHDRYAVVKGVVDKIETSDTGSKAIIKVQEVENLERSDTPHYIQMTFRSDEGLEPGQTISFGANIKPPAGPAIPGDFSFKRYSYFKNIGAIGFAYGQPEILQEPQNRKLFTVLEQLRRNMSAKVLESSYVQVSAVMTALLTGQRAAIDDASWGAFRESGLAHMLAISGLHVGLFSGFVFFISRFLMACVPYLALNWPIKKIAAFAGIMAAVFYTVFVGAGTPSVRAMMMTVIAFFAIMADRSPVSLRLVSFAALVLLIWKPENLTTVSFQMSFSAVLALVLFYEALRPKITRWYSHAGLIRKSMLYFGGICATTMIATIATAPFALYHFNALAKYGLLANVLAMPILSFVVMPSAVLTFLLAPFNLEWLALKPMSWGTGLIIGIAKNVESLPNATFSISQMPFSAFLILIMSIFSLFALKGFFRFLCVPLFAVFMALVISHQTPQLLVSSTGKLVGVHDNKTLYVSSKIKERFLRSQWMEQLNVTGKEVQRFPAIGCEKNICCDMSACHIKLSNGERVSYLRQKYALSEDCSNPDIDYVIALFGLRQKSCTDKKLIEYWQLKQGGSHSISLERGATVLKKAVNQDKKRPWQ